MQRIPRHEEKMLIRWFSRSANVRSVHGLMLNAAPFAEAVRDHRRDHTERVRALRAQTPREDRRANEPWDPLPITAQPSSPKAGTRYNKDSITLSETRLLADGIVSQRIDRLDALNQDTLRIVYGDIGGRYELGNQPLDELAERTRRKPMADRVKNVLIDDKADDWGQLPRVYALIRVTKPGIELLAAAASLLPRIDSQDYERVRTHLLLRGRAEYKPLQLLIEKGILAAEARFARAAAAWNQSAS
jgi:hypothetical protein